MIALLLCECGGAELRARQTLQQAGMKKFLEPIAYRGKKACLDFLSNFPNSESEAKAARSTVNNFDSYCIIFGYNENEVMWTDMMESSPTAFFDAETIIDRFGDE